MNDVFKALDLTNLKKVATKEDIRKLCAEAIEKNTKSVCVQPCYVDIAARILEGKKPVVCTVIGFPNGYNTTVVKKAETLDALVRGAKEIDMVVNINWIKDGEWGNITSEIAQLAVVCHDNDAILKVIVETCLLTDEEKVKMCEICLAAGADYIKTSTGFDSSGAQLEDIELMYKTINGRNLKIKASGGIRTVEAAQKMMDAGADRIGASGLK